MSGVIGGILKFVVLLAAFSLLVYLIANLLAWMTRHDADAANNRFPDAKKDAGGNADAGGKQGGASGTRDDGAGEEKSDK